jgi:phosphoribosylaminoimidazolecarboxamide formyltransferase/IMP cyclohydrolase
LHGLTHALISVSNKTGVVELAQGLARLGIDILSTGGTARALREHGVEVTEVSQHTGFPEMLGGRVKTLHPRIHGGILARGAEDAATLESHAIPPIGLVVVNLYPFRETVSRPECSVDEGIEQIDIGGPAMLRAAAKNHRHVLVVVNPDDYAPVLAALETGRSQALPLRRRLALEAFRHTASYDAAIVDWLVDVGDADGDQASAAVATAPGDVLPGELALTLTRRDMLRYGENPHQAAAIYDVAGLPPGTLGQSLTQLAGKALSFNNIVDAETALGCVQELHGCACVIVKHANPCGAATDADPARAYARALAADPTSAFGGIVAFNQAVDAAAIQAILERQFVEVIVCPAVAGDPEAARAVLSTRPAVRLLTMTPATDGTAKAPGAAAPDPTDGSAAGDDTFAGALEFRPMRGGLLVQRADVRRLRADELRVVTRNTPSAADIEEMQFAWTLVKWVKSNAIVYTRDRATVGIGAGQTSRVDAARFGVARAEQHGLPLAGAVMASDAFFPFRDGIDSAASHGVRLVIQPGGSKRDDEVIAAADEHGMTMVFTGHRHFRH